MRHPFWENIEMRSIIVLVAVIGAVVLAIRNPAYEATSMTILGSAVTGYFALSVPRNQDGETLVSPSKATRTRTKKEPTDPGM